MMDWLRAVDRGELGGRQEGRKVGRQGGEESWHGSALAALQKARDRLGVWALRSVTGWSDVDADD